jgi:hypothetical protein
MFMMNTDSDKFHTYAELESKGWAIVSNVFAKDGDKMLPLYEAKMLHHYDNRWATYDSDGMIRDLTPEEKRDANVTVLPRYWIAESEVEIRRAIESRNHDWFMGWRDICRATDERTMISSLVPFSAVGEKFKLAVGVEKSWLLAAQWSSFAFDFVSRQKIGATSMSYFLVKQLPALDPRRLATFSKFIDPRVRELTYTAFDMTPFARDLGDTGAPFRWDEDRRQIIRAELDALFFHLYGISREDADYILDTFPIVKRKDDAKYGTYRTKELIRSIYDRMAAAGVSLDVPLVDGENFTSTLTPAPGHGPRHDAERS